MIRRILVYGAILAALVFALKWLQWEFLIKDSSLEMYIGLIALFFMALGVWVATQAVRPKVRTIVVEKEVVRSPADEGALNEAELKKLNLSEREYEVLQLLAKGSSNAEIGRSLFLSVSTVKTHASNLFLKMDVKSRMQAAEKAKRLKLIP